MPRDFDLVVFVSTAADTIAVVPPDMEGGRTGDSEPRCSDHHAGAKIQREFAFGRKATSGAHAVPKDIH